MSTPQFLPCDKCGGAIEVQPSTRGGKDHVACAACGKNFPAFAAGLAMHNRLKDLHDPERLNFTRANGESPNPVGRWVAVAFVIAVLGAIWTIWRYASELWERFN